MSFNIVRTIRFTGGRLDRVSRTKEGMKANMRESIRMLNWGVWPALAKIFMTSPML